MNDLLISRIRPSFAWSSHPILIAGPCAIETKESLELTASTIKKKGWNFLRGGAFKPRTSPYSFQGLGEEGLKMLRDVSHDYNLNCISEVLSPEHVPLVSEYVDILQVGSRNAQNFELLKAVGTQRKPVLLKRGMMMKLEEWLLAAEYVAQKGNSNIIFCERGIRTFETETRNTLDLSAIQFIKSKTHLPIIVDPSHASGKVFYVPSLAKAAMAAGADGLMVEVHPDPSRALCDGEQALDLNMFLDLNIG